MTKSADTYLLVFALVFLALAPVGCNEQNFPYEDSNLPKRQARLDEATSLIEQVAKSNTKEAINALAHMDHRVRRKAALRLGELKESLEESVPSLINALGDKHSRVRTAAARSLAMLKDHKAIDPLVRAMADPDRKVRLWAWKSLLEFNLDDVFPILISHLAKSAPTRELAYRNENGKTVFLRLELNSRIPTLKKQAVQPMIDALEHKDEWVRGSAILILGDIGPEAKDALPALSPYINNKNEHHAIWTADALGKIGDLDPIVMPTLKAASEHKNEKVAKAAKKAIRDIEKRERKKTKKKNEAEKKKKERESKKAKKKAEKKKVANQQP